MAGTNYLLMNNNNTLIYKVTKIRSEITINIIWLCKCEYPVVQ